MAERAIDVTLQMRSDRLTGADGDEHDIEQQGKRREHHAKRCSCKHQPLDHLAFDHLRAAGGDVLHIRDRALDVRVELAARVNQALRFVQRIDALFFAAIAYRVRDTMLRAATGVRAIK